MDAFVTYVNSIYSKLQAHVLWAHTDDIQALKLWVQQGNSGSQTVT